MKNYAILVELDCLLDTRIATVAQMDSLAAVELIDNDYWKRISDDFATLSGGLITNEAYQAQYAKRDKETLKGSRPTNLVNFLHDLVVSLENSPRRGVDYDRVVVDVNIHPYSLSDEERTMLVNSIMVFSGGKTEVRIVKLPMGLVSPHELKTRWRSVFMYDFDGWFTQHQASVKTMNSPDTHLFVPQLLREHQEEVPSIVEGNEESEFDTWRAMELAFSPKVCLEMLPAFEYSLLRK